VSVGSPGDIAPAVAFTHFFELRQAVAAVRAFAGLTTTWVTDPAATVADLRTKPVRAAHLNDLRTQLAGAFTQPALYGLTLPGWVAPNPTATNGPVLKDHFQQIRNVVK